MWDDPVWVKKWLTDCSDLELALLYRDWISDEFEELMPVVTAIPDECFRRGLSLAHLETLLINHASDTP